MKRTHLIATLFVSLALVGSTVLVPRKAEALAFVDFANLFKNTITSAATHAIAISSGATAVSSQALVTKEFALDPLAWMVKNILIQSITKSTVNWINSGFHGSPAFVTDLSAHMLQVGDTFANDFLNQLETNVAINSPFRDAITQAVRANYLISSARDGFFLRNPFTLAAVSSDPASFQRGGSFNQTGGWNAWFGSLSNMANNRFGAQILAQDALQSTVNNALNNQRQQLQWSGGFRSFQGNNCSQGGAGTSAGTSSPVHLSNIDPCLFQRIQTPGATIAPLLNKAIGAGQDQLITADEINEIVGALMSQLVNHVLGAGGLSGVSDPAAGGGRSYIDQAADPSQVTNTQSPASATSISAQFLSTLQNQENQLQQYQSNWQKINTAAISAKASLTANTSCTNAESLIASYIQPVITQSADAITTASAAITRLDTIKSNLVSASAGGDANAQSDAVTQASTAYQAFLSASTTPSVNDVNYAAEQSQDTLNDPSTDPSVPKASQTLYSQVVQIGSSCSVSGVNTSIFNFQGFNGIGPNL